MLRLFALTTILLTCADHWTTYLCLHAPVSGWHVTEANPFADQLFAWAGLTGGLLIDSAITLSAVAYLGTTRLFARPLRVATLAFITCATGYAVVNNLGAIRDMGLSPWTGLV